MSRFPAGFAICQQRVEGKIKGVVAPHVVFGGKLVVLFGKMGRYPLNHLLRGLGRNGVVDQEE